ncbi:hypothetical protein RRG08_046560 [Elysia crispata]|uniref:Uncharacterized protein n=1 Tax=Elysia crispata TaxID=231223 RepID=A0AAE1AQF1_9GAST|nr:hypothetical protein RRG08_046560 [Elysia crispata]
MPIVDGQVQKAICQSNTKWQQVEIYMEASGVTSKPPKTQAAIILHCAGLQALEVFDQLNFEDEEEKERL